MRSQTKKKGLLHYRHAKKNQLKIQHTLRSRESQQLKQFENGEKQVNILLILKDIWKDLPRGIYLSMSFKSADKPTCLNVPEISEQGYIFTSSILKLTQLLHENNTIKSDSIGIAN